MQHTRGLGSIAFCSKPAVGFLVKHLSRRAVEHLDAPRAVADEQGQCLGHHGNALPRLAHLILYWIEIIANHHPLLIRSEIATFILGDTEHIRHTKLDAHYSFAVFKQHLISFDCPLDIGKEIG